MRRIVYLMLMFMPLPGFANGVGNGGDLLRKLFADARTSAGEKARQIKPCSFGTNVPKSVIDWIISHRNDYASDILRTQQAWITDAQPTCAWTQTTDAYDVTLSFEACRTLVKEQADAAHILFHESVHHFGISDENFSEAVANAMDNAVVNVTCPPNPQDPFNPDACPANPISPQEFLSYFSAGGAPVYLSAPSPMYYRSRKCLGGTEDTCTAWKYETYPVLADCLYSALTFDALFEIENGSPKVRVIGSCVSSSVAKLTGIGTDRVTGIFDNLPLTFSPYHTKSFPVDGRLTKDCLNLVGKVDIEHEVALLLRKQ